MKDAIEMRPGAIRIVAAKGGMCVIEYEVRETEEPGSVPNWFPGVILLLRDEIEDDEKIIVEAGIIRIAKKTAMDRFLDWVRGRRGAGQGPGNAQGADRPKEETRH